jgi:hypothetical protein
LLSVHGGDRLLLFIEMNTKQPTLFDASQPRSLEVSGNEMIDAIRELKARGAHVSGMAAAKPSGWRLSIEWPTDPKTCFHPPDVLSV